MADEKEPARQLRPKQPEAFACGQTIRRQATLLEYRMQSLMDDRPVGRRIVDQAHERNPVARAPRAADIQRIAAGKQQARQAGLRPLRADNVSNNAFVITLTSAIQQPIGVSGS